MIFLDSNVLIDIASSDPVWRGWSISRLEAARRIGFVYVSDIVYAEFSARFHSAQEVDAFCAASEIAIARPPLAALFLAGAAHRRYRQAGGVRTGVLADFIIGAHAVVERAPLLTRDIRRYRTYFPELDLIAPGA